MRITEEKIKSEKRERKKISYKETIQSKSKTEKPKMHFEKKV